MRILTQIGVLKSGARRVLHALTGLLGNDCLLCGASRSAAIICQDCAAELPRLPASICPRCAQPTPGGAVCGRCLAQAPSFDATLAAFRYDFPLDRLIQSFKYGHRLALAPYLGEQLLAPAAALIGAAGTDSAPLIVPLPLHHQRLRQRGFNQALELARPVACALNLPIDVIHCRRTRDTPAQADLTWRERVGNMRNAFACTTDLDGRHVILIDDVMTTGATLDECARTLKLHGAARVSVLVLARALARQD